VLRVTGGSPLTAAASRLQGSAFGRCLDVGNASTAAGATVPTWDCHTADHQLWTSWADGEIRLRRQEPGRSQPRHHQQHPVIQAAPPDAAAA